MSHSAGQSGLGGDGGGGSCGLGDVLDVVEDVCVTVQSGSEDIGKSISEWEAWWLARAIYVSVSSFRKG